MKIYNPKAPSHYNKYWSLEDNEPEVKEMAESILLHYIQSWGQNNKKRLDTLAKVANKIGFNVAIVKKNKEFLFKVSTKETERFNDFREKIRDIGRGNFENEVVQIVSIIKEFYVKRKWWQSWKIKNIKNKNKS